MVAEAPGAVPTTSCSPSRDEWRLRLHTLAIVILVVARQRFSGALGRSSRLCLWGLCSLSSHQERTEQHKGYSKPLHGGLLKRISPRERGSGVDYVRAGPRGRVSLRCDFSDAARRRGRTAKT